MVFPLIKMPLLFVFQIGGGLFIDKSLYQEMKPYTNNLFISYMLLNERDNQ